MADTHIGLSIIDQGLDERAETYTVLDENFSLKKPTVFYFGGQLTSHHDLACCGARFLERLAEPLKITRDKADFIGVCYQGLTVEEANAEKLYLRRRHQGKLSVSDKNKSDAFDFDDERLQYPTYLREFYEYYFKPLIAQKTPNGDFEKLPVETAQKNMRNVNIIAHSHGACAAALFGDLLNEKMIELGYDKTECTRIQQQIFLLNAGSMVQFGTSKFTTINFISRADKIALNGFVSTTFNQFLGKQSQKNGGCKYYKLTPNESVLTVDELCTEQIERKDRIEHAFKNYLSDTEDEKTADGHTASEIALDLFGAAVCNSIFNNRAKIFAPLSTALNKLQNLNLQRAEQNARKDMAIYQKTARIYRPAMLKQLSRAE